MDRYFGFSAVFFQEYSFKFAARTRFQNSKASRIVIISTEEHEAWSEDEPSKLSHRDALSVYK